MRGRKAAEPLDHLLAICERAKPQFASVAPNVICASPNVRLLTASISGKVSLTMPFIAVPDDHHCEPLHVTISLQPRPDANLTRFASSKIWFDPRDLRSAKFRCCFLKVPRYAFLQVWTEAECDQSEFATTTNVSAISRPIDAAMLCINAGALPPVLHPRSYATATACTFVSPFRPTLISRTPRRSASPIPMRPESDCASVCTFYTSLGEMPCAACPVA